ncbi:DUF4145 domain-containing protein (plasmid) [Raoultella ornithinolytica]|uniref:DUF4145 domain-containing protein n=2 Tax=Enterobacteriaceae TaxID=543 RepID=UPI000B5ABB1B|nr:DUF4145 domain-containing protein [Raoultella ornithinolytica]MDM9678549.1 DUF4145 domain-containing protein [Raoultella planticola]MBZ7757706.1 DUF4145 domain-containing protein [Raoultella ornithinolytica]MCZ0886490.1 DUF4145 domain-containing protein [Raoultella ornithinolytica]MTF12676.1 DUF4145 domain-containing protein [Raoultella ornithinolytica]OWY85007.1 hypothetical protein CAC00_26280 [Raoultella ornithinolytica]
MPGPFPTVSFTEDNIPEWLCPACMAPSLELLPGSFHSQHSAYSLHNRREDWYDYDHEEFVFTCILQCRRSSCRESVAVSGSGRGEREPDERQEDMVYYTLYRAKSFTPPLPVFSLPEDCPEDVKCQLKMAASLLPISGSAALNSMRIALELLLDNMEIPRFSMDSGKPWPIKLGTRIERFKDKLGPHYETFHALKDIGNHASHSDATIRQSHIEGACSLMEDLIKQLFDKATDFSSIARMLQTSYGRNRAKG